MTDSVNHPSHYVNGPTHSVCGEPIECIDIVSQRGFLRGNAIKYLWRAGAKVDEMQDLRKAQWYIQREIEQLEAGK